MGDPVEETIDVATDASLLVAMTLAAGLETVGEFLEIATKDEALTPFDVDIWRDEQRSYRLHRSGRDLVLKPRQIGFSTICLAEDLLFAITHEGVNVLVVGHDKDLVQDLFKNLKTMFDSLRRWNMAPRTSYDSVRELYFPELRSSIRVVEAGKSAKSAQGKGRSGTVHRLHLTEVAFWQYANEAMPALLSCVPKTGEIVIESTPNGVGNLFHAYVVQATAGKSNYHLHFFPWYEHREYRLEVEPGFNPDPRDRWEERLRLHGCDDEQIAWWRSKVDDPGTGLEKALQEYPIDPESCFRTRGNQYLDPGTLDWLGEQTRPPRQSIELWGEDLNVWIRPGGGRRFIVAGDVAEGVGKDGSDLVVIDEATAELAASWRSDTIDPGDFGLLAGQVGRMYGEALVALERNNHGHAANRALLKESKYRPGRIYTHDDRKYGWPTNQVTRPPMWSELRRMVKGRIWSSPDGVFVFECKTLIIDEDGKPRALRKGETNGCTDDAWTATAIGLAVRSRPRHTPTSAKVSI